MLVFELFASHIFITVFWGQFNVASSTGTDKVQNEIQRWPLKVKIFIKEETQTGAEVYTSMVSWTILVFVGWLLLVKILDLVKSTILLKIKSSWSVRR